MINSVVNVSKDVRQRSVPRTSQHYESPLLYPLAGRLTGHVQERRGLRIGCSKKIAPCGAFVMPIPLFVNLPLATF